jgi:uncharacterized protein involved in exopolysaccharide biosynthesis/Mrp family chromosome partitioning ATPase
MSDESRRLIERAAALLPRAGSRGPDRALAADQFRSYDQGGRANRAVDPRSSDSAQFWDGHDRRGLGEARIDLRQTLTKFWARKRVVLAATFIGGALAFAIAKLMTPIYTGYASVLVKPEPTNNIAATEVSLRSVIAAAPEAMPTQALLLQSGSLVLTIIERLHLDRDPEFNPSLRPHRLAALWDPIAALIGQVQNRFVAALGFPAEPPAAAGGAPAAGEAAASPAPGGPSPIVVSEFLKRLSVGVQNESDVINVSFGSSRPALAAAVPNTLIQLYLDRLVDEKERVLAQQSERLDNVVIPALRKKMQASESALAEYRRKTGLVGNQNATVLSAELSETRTQLALAHARATEAAVQLSQAESHGASPAAASESPTLQILREQEVGLQAKLAALSDTLGPNNPERRQMEAQLRQLRGGIGREGAGYIGRLKAELSAAKATEAKLDEQVATFTREYARVNGGDLELQNLVGQAEADRLVYEKYLARANETRNSVTDRQPQAEFISRAAVPLKPTFPPTRTIVLVGLTLGAGIGLVLAVMLDGLVGGLRNKEQVEDALGIRCLGSVPMIPGSRGGRPLAVELQRALRGSSVFRPSNTGFAQAVRNVQLKLLSSDRDGSSRIVLVTAALPEEGKTWMATSLATSMTADGHNVVLIDCDLHRPTLHRVFDGPRGPGLTDYFAGGIGLDEIIHHDPASGVRYIPVGSAGSKEAWRITSGRMHALIGALEERNAFIILDSAPVLAVSDAVLLSQLAQKAILVIKWGSTPPAVARHAASQLLETGGAEVAALLSMVNTKRAAKTGDPVAGVYKKIEVYYGGESARD